MDAASIFLSKIGMSVKLQNAHPWKVSVRCSDGRRRDTVFSSEKYREFSAGEDLATGLLDTFHLLGGRVMGWPPG